MHFCRLLHRLRGASTLDFDTHLICIMHSLNMHEQLSSGARGLEFGLLFYLCPYFISASCEGSGKTAHLNMLV